MSDIFISYSRKDIAFARLLHESLKENGFETWIDWQDIPPSTDWLNEVFTAIEQSDTFIFILSSSSTISDICKLEIEHARKNNKRLIPIVINDVEPSTVHPVLAAINWIFSRTKDEYQPAIADLITAIQTDFEWVKAHTRLQMRALEWERAGGDKSFLLRGSDLNQAEEWFAKAAQKSLEPTLLQTQYLQTSRQESVKRQRSLLLGVGAALIITAMLGVVAVINGQRAAANAVSLSTQVVVAQNAEATAEQEAYSRATQQSIAEEQKEIALARQLAAEALLELDKGYDLPLLLSLEANRMSQDANWAKGNLLTILQTYPGIAHTLRAHTKGVYTTAFSPDNLILASAGIDQTIILWDVSNPDYPRQCGQPLIGHTESVYSLAFSPDGKALASGGHDRRVILWDVSNPDKPKQINQLIEHTSNVTSIAFSPDGKTLATAGHDRIIFLWDVNNFDTPSIKEKLVGHSDSILSIAFSPDGKILASGGQKEEIILWDLRKPVDFKRIPQSLDGHKRDVNSVIFNPDGKLLISGSSDRIIIWNIQDPYEVKQIGQPITSTTNFTEISINPDGNVLATGSSTGHISLWDISFPDEPIQLTQSLFGHSNVSNVSFGFRGDILASSGGISDDTIILWDMKSLNEPWRKVINASSKTGLSIDFSPDGKTLSSGGTDNNILLWDFSNLKNPKQIGLPLIGHSDWVNSVAFNPEGKLLASGGKDNLIILWDVTKLETPKQIGEPLGDHISEVKSVEFSPDGKILASGGCDPAVILWDISVPDNPKIIGEPLTGDFGCVNKVIFSPDGQIIIVGSNNSIDLWDISNPEKPEKIGDPITGQFGRVYDLIISQDGRILISGNSEGLFIIWDLTNLENPKMIVNPFKQQEDARTGSQYIAVNPDFNILVSGGSIVSQTVGGSSLIEIWDISELNSPRQMGISFVGHSLPVTGFSFHPEGMVFASVSWDDSVVLWDVDVEAWKTRACNIAGRNMSEAEWSFYLPFEPYRKTCPQFP